MITDADVKKLKDSFKDTFITKDDLKPIRKDLKKIQNTLDMHIRQTDRQLNYHHRRLTQLEEKVDVTPPPYLPKVN